MTDRRTRLPRNRITMAWADEADAMGVPAPTLIVADLARIRAAVATAAPALTDWEWRLVSHLMPDEGMALIADARAGEAIVSGQALAAAIVEWADGAPDDEILAAERLARRAATWSDVERWALMIRRREGV